MRYFIIVLLFFLAVQVHAQRKGEYLRMVKVVTPHISYAYMGGTLGYLGASFYREYWDSTRNFFPRNYFVWDLGAGFFYTKEKTIGVINTEINRFYVLHKNSKLPFEIGLFGLQLIVGLGNRAGVSLLPKFGISFRFLDIKYGYNLASSDTFETVSKHMINLTLRLYPPPNRNKRSIKF